jgi:hypothetical protein
MTAHRTEVLLGLDTLRSVRAIQFLPGLIIHKALDCPPGEAWQSITYERIGLAVVARIEPGDVGAAKLILAALDWDITPDQMLVSDAHKEAGEQVMALTNKERSNRQEARIAKDTGGRRQPGSGSRVGYTRDVVLPRFKIEAKTTLRSTYSLDIKDLAYLKKESLQEGKVGVYIVEMDGNEELCIIPKSEADDDLLLEATVKTLRGAGTSTFTLTSSMSVQAVHGTVFELELYNGMYYCFSYERFLRLAKRGGV